MRTMLGEECMLLDAMTLFFWIAVIIGLLGILYVIERRMNHLAEEVCSIRDLLEKNMIKRVVVKKQADGKG
jgi:hypothetical protein